MLEMHSCFSTQQIVVEGLIVTIQTMKLSALSTKENIFACANQSETFFGHVPQYVVCEAVTRYMFGRKKIKKKTICTSHMS